MGLLETDVAHKFVGRIVGESLDFPKELHAAESHLRGDVLHIELGIGNVFLDNAAEIFDKVFVGIDNGILFARLLGNRYSRLGEVAEQRLAVVNQVGNARAEQLGAERLGDIGIGATRIAVDALPVERAGCEHQHRDVASLDFRLQAAATLKPVHSGHHYIADYDIGDIFHGAAYSFRTVGGFEHGVGVGEHIAHV